MRVPAPSPLYPVGSLVIYETISALRVAHHLFAVLGEAKPDQVGRAQTVIQAITRRPWYGPQPGLFTRPAFALSADLTPIEHYGRRVKLGTYSGTGHMRVHVGVDESLPHLAAREWSKWPYHAVYDETDVADPFLARIVSDYYRRTEREAAA